MRDRIRSVGHPDPWCAEAPESDQGCCEWLHEAADHRAVGGLYRPRQVRVPVLHDLGPEHQSEDSISCFPPIRGQYCDQLTNHSSPDHGLLLLLLLLAQPDAEQVRRDLLHAQVHSLPSPGIRIFFINTKIFFSDRDFLFLTLQTRRT